MHSRITCKHWESNWYLKLLSDAEEHKKVWSFNTETADRASVIQEGSDSFNFSAGEEWAICLTYRLYSFTFGEELLSRLEILFSIFWAGKALQGVTSGFNSFFVSSWQNDINLVSFSLRSDLFTAMKLCRLERDLIGERPAQMYGLR
jgi:hypothetical protein